jgi:3-oxoacyl-[acyl-carrier protein] reductase
MDFRIQGKTALVLGASQGIGQAIAKALAAEGVNLLLAARNADNLAVTQKECQASGVSAEICTLDLSDATSVSEFITSISGKSIDILVSNSGGPPASTVPGIESSAWVAQFQSMVLAQIQIIEAVLPGMRERGWGRIQVVSSSGIQIPIPHLAISNTLRASLAAYCKTLAGQVAAQGVTVNLLLPGRIDTDRVRWLDQNVATKQSISVEQAKANSVAQIPAGRYGEPEEFGSVAAFYASDQAGYLTGNQIRIDGGLIKAL